MRQIVDDSTIERARPEQYPRVVGGRRFDGSEFGKWRSRLQHSRHEYSAELVDVDAVIRQYRRQTRQELDSGAVQQQRQQQQ